MAKTPVEARAVEVPHPGPERRPSLRGCRKGPGGCPLAQQRLDEALRLATARRVGLPTQMTRAQLRRPPEDARAR
jgi:hypothetical protein